MNAMQTYDEMVTEYIEIFGVEQKGTELQARTLLGLMLLVAEKRGGRDTAKEALQATEDALVVATDVFAHVAVKEVP